MFLSTVLIDVHADVNVMWRGSFGTGSKHKTITTLTC